MNKPLVTVIIPIYNSSRFLADCLDSVIKQSYKNIEIICVDDGSSDNSAVIAQAYMRYDSRISLISQENLGQSAARNRALKVARGKYVSFIDSDDLIENEFFSKAISILEKKKVDAVIYNMQMFLPTGEKFDCFSGNLYPVCNGYIKVAEEERCVNITNAAPVVFRKSKVPAYFVEGMIYEDWVFMVGFFSSAETVYWLNRPYYKYRRGFEKTTTSNVSEKCLDLFKAYYLSRNIINEKKLDHHFGFINDYKIINEGIGFIEARLLCTEYNDVLDAFMESLCQILNSFSVGYFCFLMNFLESKRKKMLKIIYYNYCFEMKSKGQGYYIYRKLKKHMRYRVLCEKYSQKIAAIKNVARNKIKKGIFALFPAYRMATYNNQILQYELDKTNQQLNALSLKLKKLEKQQKKLMRKDDFSIAKRND